LDDVLRAIVWDMKLEHAWNTTRAAKQLGLRQQTLATFLDEKLPGTTLDTLSRICAALKTDPVELFRRHERYKPETRAPFAEDTIFDRFRALLTVDHARRLARLLEVLIDRQALAKVIEAAEVALQVRRLEPTTRSGKPARERST
jgi:DNA-binding Xre family transcriptional regulator